ncbi:MAG: DUF4465 domain-containing protein [Paramuribaculum sp.]|nr:DUF4465 domain-containing protein [Paramuribaculum sp.]
MRLSFRLLSILCGAAFMASCSEDGPEQPTEFYRVIDFENTRVTLAGPTSYGANLYANFDGPKFTSGAINFEEGVQFLFGINESLYDDEINFWNGGMVLSQWNYRSNPEGESGDWWMSFNNQCSVYNTASTDGANRGAGAGGSNTFAVINGYDDPNSMSSMAKFSFSNGALYEVYSIEICTPSYVYGLIANGNPYGGGALKDNSGWFKIMAYGFDAEGNPTNGGQPVEKYICDYRNPNKIIETIDTWQTWDLYPLGKVNTVKFQFAGSDTGAYGLNTPAYMCLDNIKIHMNAK